MQLWKTAWECQLQMKKVFRLNSYSTIRVCKAGLGHGHMKFWFTAEWKWLHVRERTFS